MGGAQSLTPVVNFGLSLGIQGMLLVYDELVLHRQRGLPRWERMGHPVDAFCFSLPIGFAACRGAETSPNVYFGLSLLSSLVILKDEWVHVGRIGGLEATVHAALFVIHPVTLMTAWELAKTGQTFGLLLAWVALLGVVLFQGVYWNLGKGSHERHQ
jgi:hypothetical protein